MNSAAPAKLSALGRDIQRMRIGEGDSDRFAFLVASVDAFHGGVEGLHLHGDVEDRSHRGAGHGVVELGIFLAHARPIISLGCLHACRALLRIARRNFRQALEQEPRRRVRRRIVDGHAESGAGDQPAERRDLAQQGNKPADMPSTAATPNPSYSDELATKELLRMRVLTASSVGEATTSTASLRPASSTSALTSSTRKSPGLPAMRQSPFGVVPPQRSHELDQQIDPLVLGKAADAK